VGFSQAFDLVVEQMQADRRNLLLVGLPGIIPFLLLATVAAVMRLRKRDPASRAAAVGGGAAIGLTLIWANASYWPMFLPGASYPGWPHGLEMIIAPLFFAPVAMLFGVLLGVVWVRRR
jgi:hypothetical protein